MNIFFRKVILFLFTNKKKLKKKFYNNKILILGPNFEYDNYTLNFINKSNIIIILNKSYRFEKFKILKKFQKEIILAHCLDQREDVGGGNIEYNKISKLGVQNIILPLCNSDSDDLSYQFLIQTKFKLNLNRINKGKYKKIKGDNMGFTPNTGTAVIKWLHSFEPKNIFISGLDFFRTAYPQEYKPGKNTLSNVLDYIESVGEHNPDADFLSIKSIIKDKRLIFHPDINAHFEKDFKQIFYLENKVISNAIKTKISQFCIHS